MQTAYTSHLWRYALILVAVGLALLPVVWMATMAFKPHTEWVSTAGDLHWLPREPTFANFEYIFTGETDAYSITHERTATKPILSSLVTSMLGTLIAVIAGTLGAYAVSRFGVGRNLPLGVLQLRLFPPLAVMIPVMIMWAFIGAMDSWWGLSLIYGIVTLPFAFWLMKTFFDEVPREIEEAALVEGCSWFRVFWKITLPMVKGGARQHHALRLHPQLERLRHRPAADPQGMGDDPGLHELAVLGDDGADVRRQGGARPHRRRAAGGLRHRDPEVSGARAHLRGAEAMSKAATKARRPVLTPLESQGTRLGLYMTLPAQLLLLFIVAFPLVMQLYVSFTWWGPLDGTPWYMAYESANLFGNYGDLFDDSKLWGSIGRTFLIVAVCVPIEFLLGLGLAILFAEKFVGKRLFYSIMLMPMMIVPAVAGYMFFMLFQSSGPINDLLSRISGTEVEILWLADSTLAMISVMIADIWQWTPLMFLILLAGMVGVPEDQMKAATLLGANAWQRFWRIVLPRMKMVMIIALVIRTIECIKIFDILYVMTGGGPGTATKSISVYILDLTFKDLEWAYVAALGLFVLICLSVFAVIGLILMQRAQRRNETMPA